MKKTLTFLFLLISLNSFAQKDWFPFLSTDSLQVIDSTFIVGPDTFSIANSQDYQVLQKINGKWINETVNLGYDSIKFDPSDGYIRAYRSGMYDSTLVDGRYFKYSDSLTRVATPKQLYDSVQAIQPFDSIAFKPVALKSYHPYTIFADTASRTLAAYDGDSNTLLQLGEELRVPICYNNSGATIPNGYPVYIDSSFNGKPTIKLASNQTFSESRQLGVTTESILNNSYGRVTRFGYVHDINLSAFNVGDNIYLGDKVLTNIQSIGGTFPALIGKVIDNSVNGTLLVYPQVTEHTEEANRISGFPDAYDTYTTVSINNTTRYFKLSPVGSSFYYYDEGIKYIKSSADSILFANTEGRHYIYYQNGNMIDGVNLTDSQIRTIIQNDTPVAGFYWDATNGRAIGVENDRYNFQMPSYTTAYLRSVLGIQYLDGLGISNLVVNGDGSLDSHAQFGVNSGNILHEDIKSLIATVASTTGIPVYYRSGANGDWREQIVPGYSFIYSTFANWNQFTGTTWQMTPASSGDFILVHIFVLPSTSGYPQLVSVAGQNVYNAIADARAAATTAIYNLSFGNAPLKSIKPIATFILETKSNFTNTPHSRYVSYSNTEDYVDFRSVSGFGTGTSGTGTSSFLSHTDTPSTYTGFNDSAVYVNSIADGLIFRTPQYLKDTANIAYLDQENTFSKDVNTTGVYKTNGTQIASSDLSNNSDIAKLSANNIFSPSQTINGAVSNRGFYFNTSGSTRWYLYTTNESELGSNAGSNFKLSRYSDAGGYLGDPISVNRNTGVVSFSNAMNISGLSVWYAGNSNSTSYNWSANTLTANTLSINTSASIGSGGVSSTGTFNSTSTGANLMPSGTTVQRPSTPLNAMFRYNSDSSAFEGYAGGAWKSFALSSGGIVDLTNYYTKTESDGRYVPLTRTVAGKALSTDITLASSDLTDGTNLAKLNASNDFSVPQVVNLTYPLTLGGGIISSIGNEIHFGRGGLNYITAPSGGSINFRTAANTAINLFTIDESKISTDNNISIGGQYQVSGSQIASTNLSDMASGSYTPTYSNLLNISTPTSLGTYYTQQGNIITVNATVQFNITSAGASEIYISLPYTPASGQHRGTISVAETTGTYTFGIATTNVVNNAVICSFIAQGAHTAATLNVQIMYSK